MNPFVLAADASGPAAYAGQLFRELTANPTLLFMVFGALVGLAIARRIPVLRTIVSIASFVVVGTLLFFAIQQQGMLNPEFGRFADRLGLSGGQEVAGDEVRIRQSRDGHFWARVRLNGYERRMLVDSGATVTAISDATARAAGLTLAPDPVPVLIRTANGTVAARTAKVERLSFGTIRANNIPVVVSPALGDFDVLGMNFLSRLKSWRVEDGVLILTPHHPKADVR